MAERMVIYSEAVRQMNTCGEQLRDEYSRLCIHQQRRRSGDKSAGIPSPEVSWYNAAAHGGYDVNGGH